MENSKNKQSVYRCKLRSPLLKTLSIFVMRFSFFETDFVLGIVLTIKYIGKFSDLRFRRTEIHATSQWLTYTDFWNLRFFCIVLFLFLES